MWWPLVRMARWEALTALVCARGGRLGCCVGGVYSLRLVFPENYPEKPPKVRFTTEMFHPNGTAPPSSLSLTQSFKLLTHVVHVSFSVVVYSDGTLCLDIIQDQWSPIYSASSILTSIQSLLTDPNPASPANPEAAHLYNTDRKSYNRRVRRMAQKSVEQ